MDTTWMERIERRQRRLTLLAGLAVLLAAGPFVDWVCRQVRGQTELKELRVQRLVVADPEPGGPSVEVTSQGLQLKQPYQGYSTLLSTGHEGLWIRGPESSLWLRPGAVEVSQRTGPQIEMKNGLIMVLGGESGQTDIGPGFASVQGTDGVAVINGRKDALGLRVTDMKTQAVHAWPR